MPMDREHLVEGLEARKSFLLVCSERLDTVRNLSEECIEFYRQFCSLCENDLIDCRGIVGL